MEVVPTGADLQGPGEGVGSGEKNAEGRLTIGPASVCVSAHPALQDISLVA